MAFSRMSSFLPGSLRGQVFKIINRRSPHFHCPVCNYKGPFRQVRVSKAKRANAGCPGCHALERHRIQYLVLNELEKKQNFAGMKVLHFAPEEFFIKYFREHFSRHVTADLVRKDVDANLDLIRLDVPDAEYDLVYASHVLEHIKEDYLALTEIKRILKPGGLAILPVPRVALLTVEYGEPNPHESHHVRAPGLDYYDRYCEVFSRVRVYTSSDFDQKHQLYEYEDRTGWPTKEMPLRVPMPGVRHPDAVPVCWV